MAAVIIIELLTKTAVNKTYESLEGEYNQRKADCF